MNNQCDHGEAAIERVARALAYHERINDYRAEGAGREFLEMEWEFFKDEACVAITAYRTLADVRLADVVAALTQRNLEAAMLASKWMEAHDRLKAGLPYQVPRTTDLPEMTIRAEAAEAEVRRLNDIINSGGAK